MSLIKHSKILSLLLVFSLVLTLLLPSSSLQADAQVATLSSDYVEGEVIVATASYRTTAFSKKGNSINDDTIEVQDSWNFGKISAMSGSAVSVMTDDTDKDYHVSLLRSSEYTTEELIELLKQDSHVLTVEPNYIQKKQALSNDSYSEKQWYLGDDGIQYSATESKTASGTPVVAVVDTGVDYLHPDLADKMWQNPYSSSGIAGSYGYDFGDNDNDPLDNDGHGTHCAGIIAATADNNLGITGIGKNAKIMALKIFNAKGDATTTSILSAFDYLYKTQKLGANVVAVNCSWGGSAASTALNNVMTSIGSMGAIFCFASGNDGKDISNTGVIPYDVSTSNKIITGALGYGEVPQNFSDYSKTGVDLFAPGTLMLSTYNQNNLLPNIYSEEKQKKILSYYDTGNTSDKQSLYETSNCTLSYRSDIDPLRDGTGGYTLALNSSGRYACIYLDVTDMNLNDNASYEISFFWGEADGNQIDWMHETTSLTSRDIYTTGGRTYLDLIDISLSKYGGQTLYLDEIAVSTPNPDTSQFEKYEYMTGTSMASPVVAGTVALYAQLYPSDSVSQRKSRILSSVVPTAALSDLCKTGGYLSLAKMDSYSIPKTAVSMTLNASSSKVSVKKSIQMTANVYPTDLADRSVTYSVSNTKYASISQTGKLTAKAKGAGKTVTVKAVSNSTKSVYATKKIVINKQKVTKIKLSKRKLTIKAGHSRKLTATAYPTYANNRKIKWTSKKKAYATVSSKGIVRAKNAGKGKTVLIYAKAKDGSKKKSSCRIKIK